MTCSPQHEINNWMEEAAYLRREANRQSDKAYDWRTRAEQAEAALASKHCDHCAELADLYREKYQKAEAELAECREALTEAERVVADRDRQVAEWRERAALEAKPPAGA